MNHKISIVYLYCLCVAALTFSAWAVQPYQPQPVPAALGEMWRWHHIEALDQEGFRCMATTPDGAIWFGVNNGLLRYDGTQWKRHDLENGFVDTPVQQLAVAKDGTVYALSRGILFRYDGKLWKRTFPPEGKSIILTFLMPANDGGVWLGSTRGLFHINENNIKLITEPRHVNGAKKLLSDLVTIEVLPNLQGPDGDVMVGLFENDDGVLTIGYTSGWFVQIDTQRPLSEPGACRSLKSSGNVSLNQVVSMLEMDDGQIWAGFGPNVYIMDISRGMNTHWPLSESDSVEQNTYALVRSAEGEPIIASPSQIFCRSGDRWESFRYPGPDSSSLPLMMVDEGQNLWVGKLHGKVYRVDLSNERWQTMEGLIFQGEDRLGAQWFLDVEGHAVRLHEGKWDLYNQGDGLIDTPVGLLCNRSGPVWVVGSHQGQAASAFLDEHGRWQRTIHKDLPLHISPSSLFEDSQGTIWFGAYRGLPKDTGGVVWAEPDGASGYRFKHSQKPNRAWHIRELPDRKMVIGAYALWALNGSSPSRIANEHAGPGEKYLAMDCAEDGSLWVAPEGLGVHRFREGEWTRYARQDGLTDNMVVALLGRGTDDVWALSANGLSYFDGYGWTPGIYGSFFPGLFHLEGSVHESKDGSLWLNYVSPSWFLRAESRYQLESNVTFKSIRCRPASLPPDTQIIDFMERVALPGSMTIRWQGTSPWQQTEDQELYYSWRLDNQDWSAYALNRDVTLRSMKPGRHTFEVRARDYDLNVDPTPAVISFVAIAPVWQQAWFILLVCLVIILIIMVLRSYKHRLVTDQQHKTELERVKLRFFTSISHELRTPLTVLLGPLQGLYEKTQDPDIKNRLRMMIRNGEKLRTLINQILDFRKLEAGKMKISWSYGDFIQSAQAVFDSLLTYAEMTSVTYAFEAPKTSCMVWFDYDKLQILLSNLISNAIKYTPSGGSVKVMLCIDYEKDAAGIAVPTSVVIRVEDTGPGISAEDQEHIFERYYRSDSNENKGSGLGLALVKELTQLLGGSILVESPVTADRQGTGFILQLPIYAEAPEGAHPAHIQTEYNLMPSETLAGSSNGEQTTKPTLLVIDDDKDIRLFVHMELSPLYDIHEAGNGSEGLERASELMPDLIISDVMMPLMDGTQLCAELKSNPLTSHIPIILLTARTAQEHELEGLKAGADAYVTKPFAIDLLKARIAALLESRKAMQERFRREIQLADFDVSITSIDQVFLERAVNIIKTQMDDWEFGPAQLARELHMSERSIQLKIKAITGETPSRLIRLIRLKCAKKMLEEAQPRMTVAEAATAVGIIDVSYFGRVFKIEFGQTPSSVLANNKK
ncbi:Sensor histidine kinase TmoS [Pontiella desulfatans]|uniref:histidine kinase n=1 Tax=Pontiella desulfatans TaxID=2750659 RepID=A0A6C2TYJ0_PONDE|nr:ATP-binding protein [Pontiella desulfatans]VGO12659.1 Sensor histidine kinase TmoS [Pontiella desulfatans]